MSDTIQLEPVTTPERLQRLLAAAAADRHWPLNPTHTILRAGEVAGCFSICAMPMITAWLDTKRMRARDTREAVNVALQIGHSYAQGYPLITHCPPDSPMFPFMKKFGFVPKLTTTLFVEEAK